MESCWRVQGEPHIDRRHPYLRTKIRDVQPPTDRQYPYQQQQVHPPRFEMILTYVFLYEAFRSPAFAPMYPTTPLALSTANSRACISGSPRRWAPTKPAANASPAPVSSTTGTVFDW